MSKITCNYVPNLNGLVKVFDNSIIKRKYISYIHATFDSSSYLGNEDEIRIDNVDFGVLFTFFIHFYFMVDFH